MRTLFVFVALCASVASHAQSGVYRGGGTAQPWSVNEAHTLIWAGRPYTPIGLRTSGTPSAIEQALRTNTTDLLVELPANGQGWREAFETLEKSKARYLLSIASLAPMAEGYAVDPPALRITGITAPRLVSLSMPAARSALVVLVTRRDNDVKLVQPVEVKEGRLELNVRPLNDLEHILYIYPLTRSLEQPDLWEGFDAHRDALLGALRRTPPGAGLRAIVNPLGTLLPINPLELRLIPTSSAFRDEFQALLETRYKTIQAIQRAWGLSISDFDTWPEFARAVPLWGSDRTGLPLLWDPVTNRTANVDTRRTTLWRDVREVVANSMARRFTRLTQAVREVVEVPVVQDWMGWSSLTEIPRPALDGVGMQAVGTTPSQISASAGRATSTVLRWSKPGWLVTTRLRPEADTGDLAPVIEDLTSLGARAIFLESSAYLARVGETRTLDGGLIGSAPSPLFFPENASNPAAPQRLPGGRWWLPSPASGNRVDLGSLFNAYRVETSSGTQTVIWSETPAQRVRLRLAEPRTAQFRTLDGSDPQPRVLRNAVEITLGQTPVIITGTSEIPIPEPAINETMARYNAMLKFLETAGTRSNEERFLFTEAMAPLDRNPGAAFTAMRTQYNRFASSISAWTWIEAESARNSTWGGAISAFGCSGNGALVLRTGLTDPSISFDASYNVPARNPEEQEVWIAARIPADRRDVVKVRIGTETFSITGPPVSPYGSGYGWYRLGTTTVTEGTVRLTLSATAVQGTDLAVDVILLYPGQFRPQGIQLPDPIDFSSVGG